MGCPWGARPGSGGGPRRGTTAPGGRRPDPLIALSKAIEQEVRSPAQALSQALFSGRIQGLIQGLFQALIQALT